MYCFAYYVLCCSVAEWEEPFDTALYCVLYVLTPRCVVLFHLLRFVLQCGRVGGAVRHGPVLCADRRPVRRDDRNRALWNDPTLGRTAVTARSGTRSKSSIGKHTNSFYIIDICRKIILYTVLT